MNEEPFPPHGIQNICNICDAFKPCTARLVLFLDNKKMYSTENVSGFEDEFSQLHPFPAQISWADSIAMLEEVFSDMAIPWVQDYLLRSHPRQDAHALYNPNNYSRSMSMYNSYWSIPQLSNNFQAAIFNVRLDVPVTSIGDIGVGIGVLSCKMENSGNQIFSKSDQFCRFVYNRENHSQLNVVLRDKEGTVGIGFQRYTSAGIFQGASLSFNQKLFLEAFNDGGGGSSSRTIDVAKLNQSLLRSYVLCVDGRRSNAKIITNHLFPNKVCDNIGEHVHKSVLCTYAGGKPMMKLPILSYGNWRFNYDQRVLRTMQRWGITDRLQRCETERVFEISNSAFHEFIAARSDEYNKRDESRKYNKRAITENDDSHPTVMKDV